MQILCFGGKYLIFLPMMQSGGGRVLRVKYFIKNYVRIYVISSVDYPFPELHKPLPLRETG